VPKVSVIIPNYNHARFLEKRIQSVLNQTYQDFDVIYLDDASTDESNKVFSQFAGDQRFRAIYNDTNSGSPFKQWNKGVRLAQGEYVWIAESDDYADARLLAALVQRLDHHPTVGLAYSQSWQVDENDNILSSGEGYTSDLDKHRWKQSFINNGKEECRQYLIFKNTIPNASAVLIRRSVYEKVGYANETMVYTGDWMLWAKMLLISDIAFIAKPLNYIRLHSGSVGHKANRNGARIKESYQTINFIIQNMNVSRETINIVSYSLMDLWFNTLIRDQGEIPWRRHLEIYQIAKYVDSQLKLRLIKRLFFNLPALCKRRTPARIRTLGH
jgi:glycosyltransferase involved in cell wall biosynthesis